MGALSKRLAVLERFLQKVTAPLAWQDLAADPEGVFRTIAPTGPFDLAPPLVAPLGCPVGLTSEEVEAWVGANRPGTSVLLRHRGVGGEGALQFIGPDSAEWGGLAVLAYDLELARIFEGEPHASKT